MAPIARIVFSHPHAECEVVEFEPEDRTGALIASKLPFTVTQREGRLFLYSYHSLKDGEITFQIFRVRPGGWENLRYKVSECPEGVRFKHYTPKDVESSSGDGPSTEKGGAAVELMGGEGVWLKGNRGD